MYCPYNTIKKQWFTSSVFVKFCVHSQHQHSINSITVGVNQLFLGKKVMQAITAKYGLWVVLICMFSFSSQAQSSEAPYKLIPTIPPFTLLAADSSTITQRSLVKGAPTFIMYFSPECGHCKISGKALADSLQFLPGVNIVLASYHELPVIQSYAMETGLYARNQVFMGRDIAYAIPSFFQVKMLPFVAVYNKYGRFVKAYENGFHVQEIVDVLLPKPTATKP